MSFIRIKTVRKNGRVYQYRYRQTNVRIGKKVKSLMEYLGRATFGGGAVDDEERKRREYQAHYEQSMQSLARDEAAFFKWQKETFGETAEERDKRETDEARFSQEKFLQDTATYGKS
jgi:hypothetical protein